MSASNEWEVKYLTEFGWVTGGYRLDCGDRKEDVKPEGAVMWARRHVTVGKLGAPSSMQVQESRGNIIHDEGKINSLLVKFGEPQFGV